MTSSIRRRILGDPSPSGVTSTSPAVSRETSVSSEAGPHPEIKAEPVKLSSAPVVEHQRSENEPGFKRRTGLIFILGGLFGLLVAGFIANRHDVLSLEMLSEMNLESLMDVIPAGILNDAKAIQRNEREAASYDSFSVGLNLLAQNISARHPVIMIPGVISTGLESWGTAPKSRQYFRKRLWGSWSMMRALVLDKSSWKQHIMLDKLTGLDPEGGIKLRAAQGFDSSDFFVTGYWIWNKILENLATIGYDPTNSFTAAYDWRLSYSNLEVRDQYFTRLKAYIETANRISGKKVVLVSHSMGSQVLFYFLHWVESSLPDAGNGGASWVDDHVDSWINISGCMLGALKGLPAVLSGEMKDTAQLNAFAVYGLEKFLSREERTEIFRAMPGISSMLPKGGDAVWGNHTWAPDDPIPSQQTEEPAPRTFGTFLNFPSPPPIDSTTTPSPHLPPHNLTVSESLSYLLSHSDSWYGAQVRSNYSHGLAHTRREVEANEQDPRKWSNPLETRLPLAPHLKLYCFYGINKPTERSYFYRAEPERGSKLTVSIDTTVSEPRSGGRSSSGSTTTTTGPETGGVDHGVMMGEGDGTVSLLSLGYMCNTGWKHIDRYNPARIPIKVFEMPHEPDRFNPRGGRNTGDHVDILGRESLNDLILRIAAGHGDEIDEWIGSDIKNIGARVKISNDEAEHEA